MRIKGIIAIGLISLCSLTGHAQESAGIDTVAGEDNMDVINTAAGEKLFKNYCAACHTIGKGKLTGPDLAGVHDRREPEWIRSFIRNSQAVIASGDETATALFEQFNKVPMPAHSQFSDDELEAILQYIKSYKPASQITIVENSAESNTSAPRTVDPLNPNDIAFIGIFVFSAIAIVLAALGLGLLIAKISSDDGDVA